MKTFFSFFFFVSILGLSAQIKDSSEAIPITSGKRIEASKISEIPKNALFSVYLKPGQNYFYIQTGPPPPAGMFANQKDIRIVSGDQILLHNDKKLSALCHYYKNGIQSDGFRECVIEIPDIDYVLIQENAAKQGAAATPGRVKEISPY